MLPEASLDANAIIAGLMNSSARLSLETIDLCFLVALRARLARDAMPSMDEELLVDTFDQVRSIVDPGADNPRQRATYAIQRLRSQQILARVDGSGFVESGEYTLTRLGSAIVEHFAQSEALTRESLAHATKTLLSNLAEIVAAAARCTDDAGWRRDVLAPLGMTVQSLVDAIDARTRGLDVQQAALRDEIAGLLQREWQAAMAKCEGLLADTVLTLRELNEVLLRDSTLLRDRLQELARIASEAGRDDVEQAASRVGEQIDRVVAWGNQRLANWSEYYQYVQRFLRSVVRLDPSRAVSERLRDGLASYTVEPWSILVTEALPLRLLREVEVREELPDVSWPAADRDVIPEVPSGEEERDVAVLVEEALEAGLVRLSEIARRILPLFPEAQRFRVVGAVVEATARAAHVERSAERAWIDVGEGIEMEEWQVTRRPQARQR